MSAMIRFQNVTKVYPGGAEAVRNLCMEVQEGETLVLLGTSGSGKTTTMKMVNRLIPITDGRIFIRDRDITEQDPITLRRGIGYAIQHIGLFPHMTVGENIAVVPGLLKWSREKISRRIDDMLSMAGLAPDDFRDRYPSQLSGGQKQRVGVARALAADPPIVLMDEPFGALDPITREQLQNEFLELESEIEKTIIFVTHDVFEAVKMGDRIALLDAGRLQQLSTPAELVEKPTNEFVENFLGRHRFQLSLLTKRVEGMLPDEPQGGGPESGRSGDYLPARASLIEALDLFKKTGATDLPVYRGRKYRGWLSKKTLLDGISEVLGQTGEE